MGAAAADAAGAGVERAMNSWLQWYYWTIPPLWALWLVIWIGMAWGTKRDTQAEASGSRLLHLGFLAVSFALLLFRWPTGTILGTLLLPQSAVLFLLGVAVALAGFGLSVWARLTLGTNWSGRITIKDGHQLIRSGPYRLLRHPIYTGVVTAVLGSALALDKFQGLLALVIVVVIYLRKIRIEERSLVLHFSDDYENYKRKTYVLIPYIW